MKKFLWVFAVLTTFSTAAFAQTDTPTVTNTPTRTPTSTPTSTPTVTNTPVNTATRTPTVKKIGDNSDLSAWLVGTSAIDPASVSANARGFQDIDVLGLQVGDVCNVEPPTALHVGLGYCGCHVVTNNRLRIYLCNHTGSGIDDVELTWRYRIWNRTVDETE